MLFDLNRAYKHFESDVRFASAEDTKSPQELEQRMKNVVSDIKGYVEREIKYEFNKAKKYQKGRGHAYPSTFLDASDWLIYIGLQAIQAIYNTTADKGLINESRQDDKNLEGLKRMYLPFIVSKVKPIYKELEQ